MKSYSVRKMGTRMGRPHYSAECNLCRRVLAHAHMGKEDATDLCKQHVSTVHGK